MSIQVGSCPENRGAKKVRFLVKNREEIMEGSAEVVRTAEVRSIGVEDRVICANRECQTVVTEVDPQITIGSNTYHLFCAPTADKKRFHD